MTLLPTFSFILLISIAQQMNPVHSSDVQGFDFEVKKCLKNLAKSALASFKSFCKKIKTFFGTPFVKMNDMRRSIKNSFYKIFDQSLSKEEENTLIGQRINPDAYINVVPEMSIFELTISHGYRTETHTVHTKDGYVVTIHRIVKVSSKNTKIGKKVVLLYHGLWGSAVDWILMGPGKSLPYILLESRYDVWLANARGNQFSNSHVTKATNSIEYWNFSWHEIGVYDISAIIDYVVEITEGKSEINFIAYSMGATALIALLSTSTHYNTAIRSIVLIAPLVFMYHVKGPIRYLASTYKEDDLSFLTNSGINELIPGGTFPDHVREKFCRGSKILCSNPLLLLGDGGKEISNINIRASVLGHVPAGGSEKTLLHYLQSVRSGKFRMFDYEHANTVIYGNKSPPSYKISNITSPILVINSINDWLSTVEDVGNLIRSVPIASHFMIRQHEFSHFDFLWADNSPYLVYLPIVDYLNNLYISN